MVDTLARQVPHFKGQSRHTRCFLHIINLKDCDLLDVQALAEGIEDEDLSVIQQNGKGDEDMHDNEDGWVDEVALLGEMERDDLEAHIKPVKLILVKVRGKSTYRCHAPNTFGTVNMECTVDSRLSWSERWVQPM